MPGAYEKQMYGDRYDSMVSSVRRCREFIEFENYEALRFEIELLILLQGGREKKAIEEFCYAGGIELLCDILKIRGSQKPIGDVNSILNNFSSLLSIEFDPCESTLNFDEFSQFGTPIKNTTPHIITFI